MYMAFRLHDGDERGVVDCRGFYRKHGSRPAILALLERQQANGRRRGITTQMAATKTKALLHSAAL